MMPESIPFRSLLFVGMSFLAVGLLSVDATAQTRSRRVVSDRDLQASIGQMIIVGFSGHDPGSEGFKTVQRQAANGSISGVFLLKRNIRDKAAVKELNSELQAVSKVPLFIAVDQEGGRVDRLTSAIGFKEAPSAARVAKVMDAKAAKTLYSRVATDLSGLGINLNLGPVVDLNVNPANPIIGKLGRSYSVDPDIVARYATAFVEAHRNSGVLTAVKHFPGHGSSSTDSHKVMTDVTATWQETELKPYETLIAQGGVDMVMASHVINRRISRTSVPASLSYEILTGLLRTQLGYSGVIVSDDMQMEAIYATRSLEQTVREAVLAGTDLLLFSNDKHPDPAIPEKIAAFLTQEARRNPKMLERIRTASANVLRLKKKLWETTGGKTINAIKAETNAGG